MGHHYDEGTNLGLSETARTAAAGPSSVHGPSRDNARETLGVDVDGKIKPISQIPDWPKKDIVNHPSHYNTGKIEVIDFIEDQHLGFNLGNVIKYICRSDHKGNRLVDLTKAQWYLAREIQKESQK